MEEGVTITLQIDRIIDMCGPQPKGSGLQNLRECIIQTKWKYDVAPEDKQVAWREMILNFMERYFYLICFATYAREHGPGGFQKSFVSVRTLIFRFKKFLIFIISGWTITVISAR